MVKWLPLQCQSSAVGPPHHPQLWLSEYILTWALGPAVLWWWSHLKSRGIMKNMKKKWEKCQRSEWGLQRKKTLWSQLHSYSECLMVWAQNVIACTVWVNTYTPSDANICAHTHTWAGVETELRGAFQGVDEWGLAKLPRGVQISSIHKQYSGPCGEEGWDEESWRRKEKKKKKKKFTTRRSREKRETRSERQLVGKKICEVK